MNSRRWLAGLVIAGLALALRLPELGKRPLHNDEAVNALRLHELQAQGRFQYDPNEFHGPSLYYASLPITRLAGARDYAALSEARLRLPTVVFGATLALLSFWLASELGAAAALSAALLTAVSPAMIFYSRYFIHEMLLVCATAVFLGGGWRWWRSGATGWAVVCGIGLGLMHATKETFVLALAAGFMATACMVACNRFDRSGSLQRLSRVRIQAWLRARKIGLLALVASASAVSVVLFTSFFSNPSGPLDSIRSYLPWIERAGGESPHIHPWYFYLERLFWFRAPKGPLWTEGVIALLAIIGAGAAFLGRGLPKQHEAPVRWLAFYTGALTGIYTVISYKTPWCLLGFFHGMILLAGAGCAALLAALPRAAKPWAMCAAAAAAAHLGWQGWRAGGEFATDPRNPYVYSQTVPDILGLVKRVEGIARLHPEGVRMPIQVMAPESEYWPLPYYLRTFDRVGFWPGLAGGPWTPVMIVSTELDARLDDKTEKRWLMAGISELRPNVFFELYVELELWKRYVETIRPGPGGG